MRRYNVKKGHMLPKACFNGKGCRGLHGERDDIDKHLPWFSDTKEHLYEMSKT
ncbi:hypothetical protein A2U01_0045247, partial [Trifolium medium]|nr:hypothetical protein [Trifolium medium]